VRVAIISGDDWDACIPLIDKLKVLKTKEPHMRKRLQIIVLFLCFIFYAVAQETSTEGQAVTTEEPSVTTTTVTETMTETAAATESTATDSTATTDEQAATTADTATTDEQATTTADTATTDEQTTTTADTVTTDEQAASTTEATTATTEAEATETTATTDEQAATTVDAATTDEQATAATDAESTESTTTTDEQTTTTADTVTTDEQAASTTEATTATTEAEATETTATTDEQAATTADTATTDEQATTTADTATTDEQVASTTEATTAATDAESTESTATTDEQATTAANLWFPDFHNLTWSVDNIYITLGGTFEVPLLYACQGAITSVGGSVSTEVGYDFYGWRIGLKYHFLGYGSGESNQADDIRIKQHMVTVQIAKEISKDLISQFPEWLTISPFIGAGIGFVSNTSVFKTNARTYTATGNTFTLNFGAYAEMTRWIPVTQWITPYAMIEDGMYFDGGGLANSFGIGLGVRTDYERISKLWRK
jgi:hypothetical protein